MSSERPTPRAVVDTNVFISSLMSTIGAPAEVLQSLYRDRFELVISGDQRRELRDVLQRPRIRSRIRRPEADITALLKFIDETWSEPPVQSLPVEVRDPKDEALLIMARAMSVDFLVTGDDDLLVLADDPRVAPLQIITPRAFLTELGIEG